MLDFANLLLDLTLAAFACGHLQPVLLDLLAQQRTLLDAGRLGAATYQGPLAQPISARCLVVATLRLADGDRHRRFLELLTAASPAQP
uniref:Putative secreted peptide n=1 Tax=Anopheles braziliensis TaxID=58242 RepID=A0A2M3ZU38_9DIPT